jgi:hypothetical protein
MYYTTMPRQEPNHKFIKEYVIFDKNTYCASKTFNQIYMEVNNTTKSKNITVKYIIENSNGNVYRKSGALFGIRVITPIEKSLEQRICILQSQIAELKKEEIEEPKKEEIVDKSEDIEEYYMQKASEELEMDEFVKNDISEELRKQMTSQIIEIKDNEKKLISAMETALIKRNNKKLTQNEKDVVDSEFAVAKNNMKLFDFDFLQEAKYLMKSLSIEDFAYVNTCLIIRRNVEIYFNDGKVDEEMKKLYFEDTLEEQLKNVRFSRKMSIYNSIIANASTN